MTVIVAALRTPIGKFGGSLSDFDAATLGSFVIKALLEQSNCPPSEIDEVIMGNVLQAGQGQGPARQAALNAGLPVSVPATTINTICGSGLKAINLATAMIDSGQADVIIAGGMENMSAAPYLLEGSRWGYKMGNQQVIDSLINDALIDAFDGEHMGITAERVAKKYSISREQQDEFAAQSQYKTQQAITKNRFHDEIIPIALPTSKKQNNNNINNFIADEYPRAGVSAQSIAKLSPVFKNHGTITAANASGINDGAAAVLLMSDTKANSLGLAPMAEIVGSAISGIEPDIMGVGPISAIKQALKKTKLSLEQIELIELNEAFAAQALAVCQTLNINPAIVNVNGGAIALGHPVGASGARILVTLLHEMQKREASLGLASLCVGGGMGLATIVRNTNC